MTPSHASAGKLPDQSISGYVRHGSESRCDGCVASSAHAPAPATYGQHAPTRDAASDARRSARSGADALSSAAPAAATSGAAL